ncbi:MAG: hypothetical protein GX782_07555 [Gammaproteobacteria bacterium]|nr:hypothetical protein [Gammaproteobacteria bacterium]
MTRFIVIPGEAGYKPIQALPDNLIAQKLRSHKSMMHLYEDAMHPTAGYNTNTRVAG